MIVLARLLVDDFDDDHSDDDDGNDGDDVDDDDDDDFDDDSPYTPHHIARGGKRMLKPGRHLRHC